MNNNSEVFQAVMARQSLATGAAMGEFSSAIYKGIVTLTPFEVHWCQMHVEEGTSRDATIASAWLPATGEAIVTWLQESTPLWTEINT